jgi:hypothetical protein
MSNIRFVAMNSYVRPEIKEVANKGWVEYGDDNNYFQYLIDRYNGSPTNNAIINGIIDMVFGKGLGATNAAQKPDEYAMMMSLFSKQTVSRVCADFKMMGNAAFQVIYNKDHSKIVKVEHIPVETLRAERCNERGDIPAYYYAKSWDAVKARKEEPVRIDAFGMSTNGIEILYIKPYKAGYYYYAPTDYQGSLPYADLEEEVANYHINNIKNGLAPSMLVNFNNGIPTEEDQTLIERRIADKFSGSSNAGRFILAFNDNKELAATIEPVQLSDASDQYQFLSTECTQKIMVGHRVTSPMLLGIKDNSGLGNNAEELKTASILFDNVVIRPLQEIILDGIEQILSFNQASLNIYFKTLQPLEFKEEIVAPSDEVVEESTGVELSKQDNRPFLRDELAAELLLNIESLGESEEELMQEFELITADIVEDEEAEYDVESYLNSRTDLAAQDESEQDTERYKVRYFYAIGTKKEPKGESRLLCRTLRAAKRVYRKEDVEALSSQGGAEAQGEKYSVWLYKGGANCYHRWERRIYRKKLTKEGKIYGGGTLNGTDIINVNQAIRMGFRPEKNNPLVAIAPIDTETRGYKK